MKKMLLVAVMVLAVSGMAMAQDYSNWEIFGGYSSLKADVSSQSNSYYYSSDAQYYLDQTFRHADSNLMNGFDFSLTRNINSWMGVKADFSRHSGTVNISGEELYGYRDADYGNDYGYDETNTFSGTADYQRYTTLFGPEFSYRKNSVVRPFAHILFGFSQATVDNIAFESNEYQEYFGGYSKSDRSYERSFTGKMDGSTGFAMAIGGGLDVKAGKHVSIRVFQLEYVPAYSQYDIAFDYNQDYFDEPEHIQTDSYERFETIRTESNRLNNLKMTFGILIGI